MGEISELGESGRADRRSWRVMSDLGEERPLDQEPDYRFTLANERTYLAWIRTALALIAGGVAVVQLVPEFGFPIARLVIGLALTAGGGLPAVSAVQRWRRVQAAMGRGDDLPPSRLPQLLAGGLLVVVLLILAVLLAQAFS